MKWLARILVTLLVATPGAGLAGDSGNTGNANEPAAVKGSKSNSSEAAGGAERDQVGQGAGAQQGAKVKGSKSNTSERTTVKSGKSNTSD